MTLYLIAAILTGLIGSIAAIWHAAFRAGALSVQQQVSAERALEAKNAEAKREAMDAEVLRPRDAGTTDRRLRDGTF